MKPFDYVNSINFTKKNLMKNTANDELAEKDYVPFIVNQGLSQEKTTDSTENIKAYYLIKIILT